MATASDITSGMSSVVRGLGQAMRGMGVAMTVGAGIAGSAMYSLSRRAQQVASAFREVDTLVQGNANSQEKYGELVSDLNTEMGLQADKLEVIEGLYQSISAGIGQTVEAQRTFMTTASKLAVVGRVELGTAVDVLSTVMNTYGMEASMATDVSESLFQTVQFGKTRMEDLAPVLGRVAALGSNLGIQIDEIGASMGVLTRTGFGARVAATGLRNIFRAMLKPSGNMQDALFQIASEQDFFASQFSKSSDRIKGIAKEFREASDAVERYTKKQKEARAVQESSSTAIQEARLKIEAIEEERLDQLPELTSETVKEANSVEELQGIIDDYQFKVNKARLQEKKWRNEKEASQKAMSEQKAAISDIIAQNGNLEGGIGQLVLENQDFVDTMVQLREKVNNTETSMKDLFPRTRALQGALALVGEDGQMLTDIFSQMEDSSFDVRDAWNGLNESAKENFNSFEEFKKATDDVQAGDLDQWFEQATGPSQRLRNSISELQETFSTLGETFSKDVVEQISNFADNVNSLVDRFNRMDENVRSNISQFAVLATMIGLVLGPLLFLGGQLLVIGSVMGTTLIPFLAVAAGLFGLLAGSLKTAMEDGQESEQMFNRMQNALSSLVGFLSDARSSFNRFVTPELINFTTTLKYLFDEIWESILPIISGGDSMGQTLDSIAKSIGNAVYAVSAFISKNEELITKVVTEVVSAIVNDVIPAFTELAKGIFAVLVDMDWGILLRIAGLIFGLVIALMPVIEWIGKFLQKNSELIGTLVTWAIIIGSVIFVVGKLAVAISSVVAAIYPFLQLVAAIVASKGLLTGAFAAVVGIATKLSALFPTLVYGLSAIATVASYVVSGLSAIAAALSLPAVAITALIAAIIGLVAFMWIARDEMVAAMKDTIRMWKTIFSNIIKLITGEIGFRQAGKNIVNALVEGILTRISYLKKGAKKVANVIKRHLGFSSAPEALGEEYNPDNWGDNLGSSLTKGMEGSMPEVKSASTKLADASVPNTEDVEYTPSKKEIHAGKGRAKEYSSSDMGSDNDGITIKEKAVFFESGAFQGVSDEELPRKVKTIVDKSMDEIVEDLRAKGADPN